MRLKSAIATLPLLPLLVGCSGSGGPTSGGAEAVATTTQADEWCEGHGRENGHGPDHDALRFSHPERVTRPPRSAFGHRTCAAKSYGAKGDGVTDDTAAINTAIATCSSAGGGTVTFADGTYMVASVHLQSNIRLFIDEGVTLKGVATGYDLPEANPNDPTNKYQDFGHSHWENSLLWGKNLVNVSIVGGGTIDGTALVRDTPANALPGQGNKQIALVSSQFIEVDGVTQVGGGHFFYLLTDCHDVTLANVTLSNGRDGMDIVGNTNVYIHDVKTTNMGDDQIALKSDSSLGRILTTDNVTVENCSVQSGTGDPNGGGGANGLQFGSETVGNFSNIAFSNIEITQAGKAGIGIQTNDGAIISNVTYDNITMHTIADPIFINTISRLRRSPLIGPASPGHIENVYLRNITATDVRATSASVPEMANAATISGETGNPHQHIVLDNVSITYNGDTGRPDGGAPGTGPDGGVLFVAPYGGGDFASGNATPLDPPGDYNPRVMGIRPAYGFYIRHVKDLTLHNVKVGFSNPDFRPAIVAFDVDQLALIRFRADRAPSGAWPSIRLDSMVTNFSIRESQPQFPNVSLADASMTTY